MVAGIEKMWGGRLWGAVRGAVPAEHQHFLQNDGERIKVIFAWFFNL